jgi:hypothetical protein
MQSLHLTFRPHPGRVHSLSRRLEQANWTDSTLSWQVTYWTDAPLATVKDWYASRLGVSPVWSDLQASGECLMMSQADLLYRLEHTVAVVICNRPRGTRVVMTDVVRWLR